MVRLSLPHPHRRFLTFRTGLSGGLIGTSTLWNTAPFQLRSNMEERRRFEQYLTHNQLNIDHILERLVDMKLENEKQARRQGFPATQDGDNDYEDEIREAEADCEAKWGAGNYFCNQFVDTLIM